MQINNGPIDSLQPSYYWYTLYNTHPKKAIAITKFYTECSGVQIKRRRMRIKPLHKKTFLVKYYPAFTTGKFNKTIQLHTKAALRNRQDNVLQLPQYNYKQKKLYMLRLLGSTNRKLQFREPATNYAEPESYFLKKEFLESNGPISILQTDSSMVNLGNVQEGPIKTFRVLFTNIGNAPALITKCQTSCGCIVATWPKKPIMPGESANVIVDFATQGRPGMCNKTITVNTEGYIYCGKDADYLPNNMSLNNKAITMRCNVIPAIKIDTNKTPPFLRY